MNNVNLPAQKTRFFDKLKLLFSKKTTPPEAPLQDTEYSRFHDRISDSYVVKAAELSLNSKNHSSVTPNIKNDLIKMKTSLTNETNLLAQEIIQLNERLTQLNERSTLLNQNLSYLNQLIDKLDNTMPNTDVKPQTENSFKESMAARSPSAPETFNLEAHSGISVGSEIEL